MVFTFVKLNLRELPWISSFIYETICNSQQQGLKIFNISFFLRSLKTNLPFFNYSLKYIKMYFYIDSNATFLPSLVVLFLEKTLKSWGFSYTKIFSVLFMIKLHPIGLIEECQARANLRKFLFA